MKFRVQPKSVGETFRTQIDMKKTMTFNDQAADVIEDELEPAETKNFNEAFPPKFDRAKLSLDLPIQITLIKLNASKNFSYKGRLQTVLKDPGLNELVDALISDSFWFVVCFFRSNNETNVKKNEELKKEATEILTRMSCNYFNFFITLCEKHMHKKKIYDVLEQKKMDSILNIFHDFMSQCVFYSLYLGFPKSRQVFNEQFKHSVISLFAYLFNGLNTRSKFPVDHWNLDLGTGNIFDQRDEGFKKQSKNLCNCFRN